MSDDPKIISRAEAKAQGIIQASWNWPFSRKDLEVYGERAYAIATGGNGLKVRLPGDSTAEETRTPPELAPDENSFYFIRRRFAKNPGTGKLEPTDRIVRRDLRSAREEVVYAPAERLNLWGQIKLSPDGKQLAVVTQGRGETGPATNAIAVVTLEGRKSQEVIALDLGSNRVALAWTPDGKRIVHAQRGRLWSVAVATGEAVLLKTPRYALGDIALHPNGRTIAFAARSDEVGGETLRVLHGALTPPPGVQPPPP